MCQFTDVDDPAHGADTSTDETTAVATASTSTDTAAPHHMPSTPLEGERRGRTTTGDTGADDHAEASWDQGHQPTTSASTPSALRDHPGEDAMTTDPPRPSEDPADATGDDECRPDAPTEPPDMPEGMRRRGIQEWVETRVSGVLRVGAEGTGDDGIKTRWPEKPNKPNHKVEGARVEAVETRLLEVSRDVKESPDMDGDKERRPGWPNEPPDKPYGASRNPTEVQVEPGGETIAGRNGDATHECTDSDAVADDRAEEVHGAVQVEGENAKRCRGVLITGKRERTTAHVRSTTADKNDQQDETAVDNIPEDPPDPSPLSSNPAQRINEPQSIKLEGERTILANFDIGLTSAETNMSGAPEGDEDPRNRPKVAQHTLERI